MQAWNDGGVIRVRVDLSPRVVGSVDRTRRRRSSQTVVLYAVS